MSAPAKSPDADVVRQFLLGQLGEPKHSEVEQLLANSSEWLSVAEATIVEDGLLDTLRSLGGVKEAPLPAAVEALIARLELLLPAGPTTSVVDQWATETSQAPDGPPLSAALDFPFLAPPKQAGELGWLGGYRVLRKLGAGGMGIVFEGEDSALQRRVALKVMSPRVAHDPEARQRFLREAQAAAAIDHPNVVPIYYVGETPVPFIAMPLLAGESLEQRLRRAPGVPMAEVFRIGIETAQGLAAAHAAGRIHRDIKPANLWLAATSKVSGRPVVAGGPESQSAPFQVKILDFGLARVNDGDIVLTRQHAMLGTPAYMPPEQANGLPVDARCDLFSLGCVLYQVATGKMAFEGATITALLRAVAEHEPPSPCSVRPEVPRGLSELIIQLLSKEADKRPTSAQAVAQTLRTLEAAGTAPPAGSSPLAASIARPWTTHRRLVLSTAGILAASVLVVALVAAFWPKPRDQADTINTVPPRSPQPTPRSYAGSVDILVWRTANNETRKLRLTDPGALPLAPKDMFRVTARIQPAAYVYLFWINQEGKADPIYPWEPTKWGTRPKKEVPIHGVDLPAEDVESGWTIDAGPEGMETVIMLVLDTPLTEPDEDLQRRLSNLKPQRGVQSDRAAVWFENGKVVENDPLRKRADFTVKDLNDPVLRLQKLLEQQLQPLARYSTAVSFARQGEK